MTIEYTVSSNLCVLRLSSPWTNTNSLAELDDLRTAIQRANSDDQVHGIVITGKHGHFDAGVDVNLFEQIDSDEDYVRISRSFQDAFQTIEDSPKPVVAAVAIGLMGSALELATACHYRVAAEGTRFITPDIALGTSPGAGATQRLPRLVGVQTALEMMLTARPIEARRAMEVGLVDAVCPPDEMIDAARRLINSEDEPHRTSQRTEKICDGAANETAFSTAKEMLQKYRPELIAPGEIVEAVRVGLEESVDAGMQFEQQAFARCMATPATRNIIYLFSASRQLEKFAGAGHEGTLEPVDVEKVSVVGMGSMGTGIAQAMITGGLPVVVQDNDPAAVTRGIERIEKSIRKRVDSGKMSQGRADGMLALLSPADEWTDVAGADLVVEAVFEDVDVKRSVLKRLEEICSADTILATNTSTISLDDLADGMQDPGRLVGMHFFNPAQRMPLVEVIRCRSTRPEAVAGVLKVARTIRKIPVVVNNREGFIVNRMFLPYLGEAFWLLEEGADPRVVDQAMLDFGFPMGPLVLSDVVGLDILVDALGVLGRAFEHHGPVPGVARRLAEEGHLGQKSGSGVYKYQAGDSNPIFPGLSPRIVGEVQKAGEVAPREIDKEEISRRLVMRLVNEAFYILEEGIAQRESDLDVAMVLGTRFPNFRGGVVRYARELGLDRVLAELETLAQRFGKRFSPSKFLREEIEGA